MSLPDVFKIRQTAQDKHWERLGEEQSRSPEGSRLSNLLALLHLLLLEMHRKNSCITCAFLGRYFASNTLPTIALILKAFITV